MTDVTRTQLGALLSERSINDASGHGVMHCTLSKHGCQTAQLSPHVQPDGMTRGGRKRTEWPARLTEHQPFNETKVTLFAPDYDSRLLLPGNRYMRPRG